VNDEPRTKTAMRRVGAVALALGGLSVLAGLLLQGIDPGPDANIGAGLLVLAGAPVTIAGAIALVVALLVHRRR
jgi:hypothetical protein